MYPPYQAPSLNLEALSGICGSISIACWIVVFSPQIAENFRTRAEGLSVVFIVVWSAGDICNLIGGLAQKVLPTMIILAIYYLLVDVVLIGQCFYYKGFTLTDKIIEPTNGHAPRNGTTEHTPLLDEAPINHNASTRGSALLRTNSSLSIRERLFPVDGTHLSPTTPLHPESSPSQASVRSPQTTFQRLIINFFIVILVIAAGILGWVLSNRTTGPPPPNRVEDKPTFNILGQIFGYLCSALYLGSRIPQLLLNHRRRSTEGISMLFFLFACIGNLTYNFSIFAYSPSPACDVPFQCAEGEAKYIYGQYILVNLSWILGSLGTLLLDMGVFVQYFMYKIEREDALQS
ncbi:PQ loop repeat family protein [Microthyrium microscopicum]|uniref:PQ loop repeat family protein n=1 Tax=Microthyrium microscopicum TaxID=703497 RepID=A0A6A6UI88_9PEZI|nr:PQ loop repeat family protein [Microthyrium microscopicum]